MLKILFPASYTDNGVYVSFSLTRRTNIDRFPGDLMTTPLTRYTAQDRPDDRKDSFYFRLLLLTDSHLIVYVLAAVVERMPGSRRVDISRMQ